MLESTKWLKYKFDKKYKEKDFNSEDQVNWTLLTYNPIIKDYVLAGVIIEVTEDYIEFLGDPAIINSWWFQESTVGTKLECLN